MKKGPVCYIYYTIKNKRQSKLEQKEEVPEITDISYQPEVYESY